MSDRDDPLDGAAVGETRTIQSEMTVGFWGWAAADDFVGSDREAGEIDLVDVEFIDDPGNEEVKLTFEGDVTKRLPRRWDEPLEEHPTNRVESDGGWKSSITSLAVLLIPAFLAFGATAYILQGMELTVNDVQVFPATTAEIAWMLPVVGLLVLLVWSVPRIVPRLGGGQHV